MFDEMRRANSMKCQTWVVHLPRIGNRKLSEKYQPVRATVGTRSADPNERFAYHFEATRDAARFSSLLFLWVRKYSLSNRA
jgi:hypothetical protein